jgi:hypothetical protein
LECMCVSDFCVGVGFGEDGEAGHFALYYSGRKTFGVALRIFLSSWCCFLDFVISTVEWRNAFLTGRILGGGATRNIYILFNYRDSCHFSLTTEVYFMQNFFYHSHICWTSDLEFHSGGVRGFGFGSFHFACLKKKIRTRSHE